MCIMCTYFSRDSENNVNAWLTFPDFPYDLEILNSQNNLLLEIVFPIDLNKFMIWNTRTGKNQDFPDFENRISLKWIETRFSKSHLQTSHNIRILKTVKYDPVTSKK